MTHMTHDPWPLHHFIVRMGLGEDVAWLLVVLDNPLGLESKKIID